ncbi:MAG TPA: MarR family winged helix-turn-helix transcriptional regulator [Nitrospiria bacterium]|nr:MarR family winged helix-turn-helix transcriptional regulator [Nitrospiria bacterium]
MSSNGNRNATTRPSPPRRKATTGPAAEQCARQVIDIVPLVMRFLRREFRRHSAPLLSVPQARTLAFVERTPGSGLSDLALHLNVARPTASLIVNRLVHQGLVRRAEHPRERRRCVLSLTPSGARRLITVRAAACAVVAGVLSVGSAGDIKAISRGLERLKVAFQHASNGSNGVDRGGT